MIVDDKEKHHANCWRNLHGVSLLDVNIQTLSNFIMAHSKRNCKQFDVKFTIFQEALCLIK